MRWIVRLFSFVLMVILLAVALVYVIPAKKVAEIAAGEFTRATGRNLTIGGGVVPKIWPVLGVRAEDVRISNAEWSTEGPMLTAKGLDIGLDASALISGQVRVTGLVAIEPQIVLERSAKGVGNWEFGKTGGAGAAGTEGAGTPFTLDRAEIKGGALRYLDHASGTVTEVTGVDATAAAPEFTGPAQISLSAMLRGQAVTLNGSVASFAEFLGGQVVGVDLAATAGAATARFKGRAGTSPLAAEGDLVADLADLGAVSALGGVARPELPQGLGAQSVTVAGGVTLTPEGSLHLRGGRVVLDGTQLAVEADLLPGEARPKLNAKITAGALNLASLMSGGGAAGGGKGWPKDRIDASGLTALDGTISLAADSVDLGSAQFGRTRATVEIDRGRAVVELKEVAAYGGGITGQVVANARDGFSTRAALVLSDMDMQALLSSFAGYDRLLGRGTVRVNVLGSGASVDALMHSLKGEGSLALGKGELRGLDVAGMLRTLNPGFVGEGEKTIFDKVTASFAVAGGVLKNADLIFEAPLLTATGEGRVDLGEQTLRYRLRPTAMAGADGGGGVMVPLIISGSWFNPKFTLDMEALAEQELADQQAELEEKARAALTEKAQEELGLTLEEGESLEDAATRAAQKALEEEAAKALGRLLGGN